MSPGQKKNPGMENQAEQLLFDLKDISNKKSGSSRVRVPKHEKTGFGIYGKTLYYFDPQRAQKPRKNLGFWAGIFFDRLIW